MAADLQKSTESMLRAVLISSKEGIPLFHLDKEYRELTMQPIPFRQLGFASLELYIKSLAGLARIERGVDGTLIVKGIAGEKDKHIAKLVSGQRKGKTRSLSRRPTSIAVKRRASHFSSSRGRGGLNHFGSTSFSTKPRPVRKVYPSRPVKAPSPRTTFNPQSTGGFQPSLSNSSSLTVTVSNEPSNVPSLQSQKTAKTIRTNETPPSPVFRRKPTQQGFGSQQSLRFVPPRMQRLKQQQRGIPMGQFETKVPDNAKAHNDDWGENNASDSVFQDESVAAEESYESKYEIYAF